VRFAHHRCGGVFVKPDHVALVADLTCAHAAKTHREGGVFWFRPSRDQVLLRRLYRDTTPGTASPEPTPFTAAALMR